MKPPKKEGKHLPPPVRQKKRFGQHFLYDRNITAKIIRAAEVREGEYVVEIGPGPGTLTQALLDAGVRVVAVELDKEVCGFLREKFSGEDRFELISGDAVAQSYLELSRDKGVRLKVVSTPPYNITGPLLAKFYNEREAFSRIIVMLRKAVARRVAYGPGAR